MARTRERTAVRGDDRHVHVHRADLRDLAENIAADFDDRDARRRVQLCLLFKALINACMRPSNRARKRYALAACARTLLEMDSSIWLALSSVCFLMPEVVVANQAERSTRDVPKKLSLRRAVQCQCHGGLCYGRARTITKRVSE